MAATWAAVCWGTNAGGLLGAEHDADAWSDYWRTRTPHVITLKGPQIREQVERAVREARSRVGRDGWLVFTLSGHGFRRPSTDPHESDRQDEYWPLKDGVLVDEDLFRLLHDPPRPLYYAVFLDTCHAGGADDVMHHAELQPERWVVAQACGEAEGAQESLGDRGAMGAFTATLVPHLQRLVGEPRDWDEVWAHPEWHATRLMMAEVGGQHVTMVAGAEARRQRVW